jgi:2-hydroxy-6-oxonona-2,4-dienedioate hydrolase
VTRTLHCDGRPSLRTYFLAPTSLFVLLSILVIGRPAVASAAAKPDGSIGGLTVKFVDVKGVKTRYYDAGQGDVIVMIHGGFTAGSSTANVFSRNIPGLAKRFRVIAPDRLGCGLTGNPSDQEYGTAAQVEFMYQFIQTLKLGRVHLVGHSAGGAIAFYLAAEHPEIVRTLTVLGVGPQSSGVNNGPTKMDLSKCPDQNVYEGLRCRVEALGWLPTTFDPEYWEADQLMATQPKSREARAQVTAAAQANPQAAQASGYRDKLLDRAKNGGVQMPILLVAGKQDVLDWRKDEPTAMLRGELAFFDTVGAKNPKVQMIIFNEGGHFMYREHPEQFNGDLLGFIDFWEHAK